MHHIIAIDAPEANHRKIIEELNSMEIPFKDGYNTPHIREIKLYNITTKEEVSNVLLEKLRAMNISRPNDIFSFADAVACGNSKLVKKKSFFRNILVRIVSFLYRRALALAGIKFIKYDRFKGEGIKDAYNQSIYLGSVKDAVIYDKKGNKNEWL